ncbi:protein scribble homolog [Fundulus diaphanus]
MRDFFPPQIHHCHRTGCQSWAAPDLGWTATNERLQGGPQVFAVKSNECGRCSVPERSAERAGPAEEIKVSGQSGRLGISIAGGKGSLPYKDQDEGIFISRVAQGGPSEKAGIHVGDRLLEVNGLSMQGAAHHEAVAALRNAGSCISLKVLRERLPPPELEEAETCLPKKIEAVVCNGNITHDSDSDLNRTASEIEAEVLKQDSLKVTTHTMTIPRIILTHPSTSDEDVEFLSQYPRRQRLRD